MAKIDTKLNTLRNEIETTIRAFYMLRRFLDHCTDADSVSKINDNIYFWRIFELSLTYKIFIGLRRLLENDSDAFSFQNFINTCRVNIDQFSLQSLEERKIGSLAIRPDWLDKYLSEAKAPKFSDFKDLARFVKKHLKGKKEFYTELGTKVYAHAILTSFEEINEKLTNVQLDELESLLNAIWTAYNFVWEFYANGRRTPIELACYEYKQEVYDAFDKQLGINLIAPQSI